MTAEVRPYAVDHRDLDRVGGVDLYELSERYGTNVRTIRRDIDVTHHLALRVAMDWLGTRAS